MPFRHDADGPQSEYELDLNALSLDDYGEFSSPLPTKHIDQVRSEDIDGPSDFTINMEKWMRGTPQKDTKSASRFGTVNRSALGSLRIMASVKETGDNNVAEEARTQEDDAAQEMRSPEDDRQEAGADIQEDTPIPDGSATTVVRDGSDTPRLGEDRSTWDPHKASVSPPPRKTNGLLQPTVEDYHGELSPARVVSMATTRQAQPAPAAQPAASLAHLYAPRMSPLPSLAQLNAPRLSPTPSIHSEEQDLSKLRAQFEELRKLQEQTSRKAEALQDQLREANEAHAAINTELDTVKAKGQSDAQEAAEQVNQIQAEVKREREEAEEARRAQKQTLDRAADLQEHINHLQDSEDEELRDLQWQIKTLKETESQLNKTIAELRAQLTESSEDNTQLQQDLESSNTTRDALESRLQSLQQEMNDLKQQYETETASLRHTLENERKQTSSTATASPKLINLQTQLGFKTTELAKAETTIANLREELELQRTFTRLDALDDETIHKHGRETSSTTSSSSTTADLRAQLEGANQALDALESRAQEQEEVIGELRAQRDVLKSSHLNPPPLPSPVPAPMSPQNSVLDEEMAAVKAALAATRAELHDSEHKRLDLHQRIDGLVAELADVRAVNAAFDGRITERMVRREEKWRGLEGRLKARIEELEGEREVMAKTLLKMWGREECGVVPGNEDEGQRFRYVLAKKGDIEKGRKVEFQPV